MVTQLLAKVAMGLIARLITEKFMSKLLVEGLRATASKTSNVYDDRVVEAIAEAFGVEKAVLTEAKKK